MHLRKTKTNNGRIYLAIVDSFYDKQKKMSRSKTIESLGYLDVLEKEYDDPITHFQKRIEQSFPALLFMTLIGYAPGMICGKISAMLH